MYQDYLVDAAEYDREMSYRKAIIEREKRVREGIGDSACSRLPRRWAKPMNPSSRAAAASSPVYNRLVGITPVTYNLSEKCE